MKLGKTQTLEVESLTPHGAMLSDGVESVLLPRKEVKRLQPGDTVDAFIYLDSEDRKIATLKKPKIELGEFVPLKVLATTRVGAFLDWGLDKDLLLPYSEQATKVMQNRKYLVKLYEDKSGRLAATMKIYPELRTDSPYKAGDWVEGYVYQIRPELGAFIAVDNKYNGMVKIEDVNDSIHNGKTVKLRVVEVRPDGKLQLSPIKKAYKEINTDAKKILERLYANDGFLPFNDRSSPEEIRAEFDISKAAFKRALGRLLKSGQISISPAGIESRDEN